MKKLPFISPLFVIVLAVALTGCGDKVGGNAQATASNTPAASATPAAQPAAMPGTWQGTVAETMDSGGYTYVLLDTGTEKLWCASTQTPIAVGDKVTIPQGQMMVDFRSATLDRVFPEIYFTTAIWKAGTEPQGGAMPQGHPGMGGGAPGGMGAAGGQEMGGGNGRRQYAWRQCPAGGPAGGTKLALDDQHVSGVAKVAGGYQVGEIYAKGAELGGKSVKVRGRVVKFTPNIMGTNWIHIQDGSGEGATVDLTVTTSEIVAIGDVIVAEGVLAIDKDFGAGYVYAAIIEKAAITKE
ncbi:MAG: hypothetical protein IPI48_14585 [bacterium]|nr:hypothetical protein [bacterium]